MVNKVKQESVDQATFDKALHYCRHIPIFNNKPDKIISRYCYLWQDQRSNYHLIYKDYSIKKVRHIIVDPYTGEKDIKVEINNAGGRAYRRMKKYLKRYNEDINFKDNDKYLDYTWKPFENMDTYNVSKNVNAWEYDSNSNYLAQMKKPLPYGDIVRENDYIGPDEIGFNIFKGKKGKSTIEAVFEGYANIIFKTKIYKGLVDFANNMYNERKTITDEHKKDEFKIIICSAHGNLKYHNIFMAVAIIGYSKQELLSYCNDVHVYMNTVDSIICDRPIDNIPLGKELGQYKLKHENEGFMYFSHGIKYWANGDVSHKGAKKSRKGMFETKFYIDTQGELHEYK